MSQVDFSTLPTGARWSGPNTQRKVVNHEQQTPVLTNEQLNSSRLPDNMNGVSIGQAPDVFFKAVTITPEARRIARILGMRSAEYIAQRLIDAENKVASLDAAVEQYANLYGSLLARVNELEKKKR